MKPRHPPAPLPLPYARPDGSCLGRRPDEENKEAPVPTAPEGPDEPPVDPAEPMNPA